MGAFDDIANIVIPDPDQPDAAAKFREQWGWESHEQVIIKGAFTGVEQELVDNASAALTRNEGSKRKQKMDVRVGTARNKLLQVMILDWTLSRNGAKVPCLPENIVRLPANYRTPILEQIDEVAKTMDEDEQEGFLPSLNGHSPAPSTMTNSSQSAS